MTCNITLTFKGQDYTIPVPFKRYVYLLGSLPETIGSKISQQQFYKVESAIKQETFDNFKKYLTDSLEPEIDLENMHDFYLLNEEFKILTDFLSTKIDNDILNLSILTSNLDPDKSKNERYVSQHLDNIIDKYEQDLLRVPLCSLVNIFQHPDRVLYNHQKAYDLITKRSQNHSLFVLLQSLDGEKLDKKSQFESLIKISEHLGYFPTFNQSFFESIQTKVNYYDNNPISEFKEENKILKDEINRLKELNQRLKIETNQKENQNQKLQEENQRLKNEINKLKELNQQQKSETNQDTSNNHTYYRNVPSSPKSTSNSTSTSDSSSNNHSYYRTLPSSPKPTSSTTTTDNSNNNHSYYRELPTATKKTTSSTSPYQQILNKADNGDTNAQYQAGLSFLKGFNDFPIDSCRSILYLRKAADKNHTEAIVLLAKIFITSNNYLEAVKYLEIGTRLNNEDILVIYGEMLCTADHVPLDVQRGVKLLQKALETVNDVKSIIIGYRFYKIHTASLLADARRCFRKGASLNHPTSIFNYGFMLEKGEGGEKDIKRAIELYKKAAEMKVIPALIHLGEICEEGRYIGSPQYKQAIEYYTRAKNLGSSEAQKAIDRVNLKISNRISSFRGFDERDLLIGMMLRDFLSDF